MAQGPFQPAEKASDCEIDRKLSFSSSILPRKTTVSSDFLNSRSLVLLVSLCGCLGANRDATYL
ncbi:hypothetical protein MUK42_28627 [Musa troglodytarum]|uniref:Uncharacterized protein n=1 Tax=Musa troglodytarum TaxID=320322 RepID=A0A9E7KC11_9LILI|nr:hypothetical protein MUK42_28627 [Musa troglodytarum]